MKMEQIKKEVLEIGIKDFFKYIRNFYLEKNGFDKEILPKTKEKDLSRITSRVAAFLGINKENLWESNAFHMFFRVTDLESLKSLNEDIDLKNVELSLKSGRELTILPLNIILGMPTIKKFIPNLPKLYSGEKVHSLDPYGLFRGQDQIRALVKLNKDEEENLSSNEIVKIKNKKYKNIYLGSRKFDYAVLFNVTEFCPVGCAECYKGVITRLSMAALAEIEPRFAKIKKQLNLEEHRAIEQAKLLSRWLEDHREVNTVIISGGEPLMYSPETIGTILDEFGKIESLKVIRICTSAVFQGIFYKISDELIEKLKKFKEEHNGLHGKPNKQLYFNCHVTDEFQLSTPEALISSMKLKNIGISLHLQMPLQEGINFFRNEVVKSAEKLKRICEAAYRIGAIPYKAIVNMHSPSYKEITVPIEKVSEVITFLDEHFDNADMERWQAYNILHEQGNAYIYPKPNFVAVKNVNKEKGRVTYFIPKLINGKIVVHTYEEPLIENVNDQNSLSRIIDKKILEKIFEVQHAYNQLRMGKINAVHFYKISGIKFSKNEPLVLG